MWPTSWRGRWFWEGPSGRASNTLSTTKPYVPDHLAEVGHCQNCGDPCVDKFCNQACSDEWDRRQGKKTGFAADLEGK